MSATHSSEFPQHFDEIKIGMQRDMARDGDPLTSHSRGKTEKTSENLIDRVIIISCAYVRNTNANYVHVFFRHVPGFFFAQILQCSISCSFCHKFDDFLHDQNLNPLLLKPQHYVSEKQTSQQRENIFRSHLSVVNFTNLNLACQNKARFHA